MPGADLTVLLAGESWTTQFTELKGLNHFTVGGYGEGAKWLKEGLERQGIGVRHLPSHLAILEFPATVEQLQAFDCVILSDIGSDSLLLHPDTANLSRRTPNRLKALEAYVRTGGSAMMIGGWMSFAGMEGKAHYHRTPVERLLPVEILPYDDRVEVPEGFEPAPVAEAHPILAGLPREWPFFLSYNRLTLKHGATVLLEQEGDPILSAWEYGAGRSLAFACDAAPHGASPEFLEWSYFDQFWAQAVRWLTRRL